MFIKNKFKLKIKENEIIKVLLFLFISFSLMPDIISIGGYIIKIMYLIFGVFCLIAIVKNKIVLPPIFITIFLVYSVFISIIMSFVWGIDRLLFNYSFGFIVVIFVITFGSIYTEKEWLELLQKVWIFLILMVLINNVRQAYRFVEYVVLRLDHPYINTVVTGGVNLEATWISIMTLAFYKNRHKWKIFFVSLAFSIIYASRVGIIANCIVWFCFSHAGNENITKSINVKKRVYVLAFSIIAIFLFMFFFSDNEVLTSVFSRFSNIGHDPGSLGRFAMWKYVPAVIMNYPFGVGLGNSIAALQKVSPLKYHENNLHNIFFQMFCEVGIVGGIYYILIWIIFVFKEIKNIFSSPISCMLLIYGVLGVFQFRGGETIFFCILGIYLVNSKKLLSKN